jgi:alpha-amylase
MVRRCKAVGVGIYADAVINHMTGGESGDARRGIGIAGSTYQKCNYPGIYSSKDFHQCGDTSDNTIQNYQERSQVQQCELVSLSDLKTSTEHVRSTIAAYLNDLLDIGVAGFRIDAAKHMPAPDLKNIYARLNRPTEILQEVIDHGFEAVSSSEYTAMGRVTEFRYSSYLAEKFTSGKIADLLNIGSSLNLVPDDKAFVFTDNHDNQRGHGSGGNVLTHKKPDLYALGNVFMLAWPYGQPKIMSSYRFSDGDQGPPSDSAGRTQPIYDADGSENCFKEWVCEHRWDAIRSMVAFRNITHGQKVDHVYSNGSDQIAFSRGNKGFVAINGSQMKGSTLNKRLQTGLPAGRYCDIVRGARSQDRKSCSGATVDVDEKGYATIDLPGMEAIAIHEHSGLQATY